jgi:hypothetical protein
MLKSKIGKIRLKFPIVFNGKVINKMFIFKSELKNNLENYVVTSTAHASRPRYGKKAITKR